MAGTSLSSPVNSTVNILLTDLNELALYATCTGTPPTTTSRFQHGCIINQLDGTVGLPTLFENQGSSAVPVWSQLESASSSTSVPFLNSDQFVRIVNNNTTFTLYVNGTTGNDANNGFTPGTAFATIQKAIDTVGASLEEGRILISVADGTYNENILLKDMMGKNNDGVPGGFFSGISTLGPNFVEIRGNTTTPGNCIVIGSGATIGTFLAGNLNVIYRINGFDIRNDNTTSKAAIFVDNSTVLVQNCSSSLVGNFVFAQNRASVTLEASTAGMVHAVKSSFITAYFSSNILIYQNMTVTGIIGFALVAFYDSAIIELGSSYATATIFSFTGVAGAAVLQATNGSIVEGFVSATVNASGFNGPFIRMVGNGYIAIYGLNTINATNCTGGFLIAFDTCSYNEFAASAWNELGTTPNTYTLNEACNIFTLDGFTGATPVFAEFSTAYKYGQDNRYVSNANGTHSGTLPLGATNYFGQGVLQAAYISLYIARQDEVVTQLRIVMETANGPAHTDIFTVVKNGVDTTMTLSITNGSSGSTVTNPVTLAAGDRIGIKAVTDAATAGANVLASMFIRKT